MNSKLKKFLANIPRIMVGSIFLFSATGKLINKTDAVQFAQIISSQLNFFESSTTELVYTVIIIEIILGLLLILNKQLILTYLSCFQLVAFFSFSTAYLLFMDISISSCGCFGAFGFSGGLEATLIRNIVLMSLIFFGYIIFIKQEEELN